MTRIANCKMQIAILKFAFCILHFAICNLQFFMKRRDFLNPRRLASAAGPVFGLLDPLPPAPAAPAAPEAALLRFARRAMATNFEVVLPFDAADAVEAAQEALDEIDRLEAQLTVYRDSSEVSRLNALAARAAVAVEPGLFDLLALAAEVHGETGGAHDVAAGALIRAWGFFRGPPRVPSEQERAEALHRTGMRHVVLDAGGRSVRYLREGLEINLGSIGKGYALDRAAALLRGRREIRAALLQGGSSSVYAMGSTPGDPRGWAVGLNHPWQPGRSLGVVRLRDRALGTSAATFKHLEYQGRKLGHLLDPRTGWPAEGVASVSVVAPTAARADALATAFFILGADAARAYCGAHPDVAVVLLSEGPDALPVVAGLADVFSPDEREPTAPQLGTP